MKRIFASIFSRAARAGTALAAGFMTLAGALQAAGAEEVLAGPVPAAVEEVIDGDTLRVRARIWLGQEVAIYVRLAGVDAPEARGACGRERALARQARAFVAARLEDGQRAGAESGDGPGTGGGSGIRLHEVRYGKFARRVVARVETAAGLDLGAALLAAGLAKPYDGGRRPGWCG